MLTPFGFSEPSSTGQILLLSTYIFHQFQQEPRNLTDFNRSNVNTSWSIYDCSSSHNVSDRNGKQEFSNRRVFLLQLLVDGKKHRKSRQCYLVKQTPKRVAPSVKFKRRTTETRKWGLICVLLHAVFVCPPSVKQLQCKWTPCLLKKPVNSLQEIQGGLLRKSARKQQTASVFFTSKTSTELFWYLYLSAARRFCWYDWSHSCYSSWTPPWLHILLWIQLNFLCCLILILPEFGQSCVFLVYI